MTRPNDDLPGTSPLPAAVTFVTTEHFTLQGARAATIAESTGRVTMFLSVVSGGLEALGLMATATRAGTAFYAFGLVILPTLALIWTAQGPVTMTIPLTARCGRLALPIVTAWRDQPPSLGAGRPAADDVTAGGANRN